MRRLCSTALILLLAGSFLMLAMEQATPEEATPSAKLAKLDFSQWYKPVEFTVNPKPVSYPHPLDKELLEPFQKSLRYVGELGEDSPLLRQGFEVGDSIEADVHMFCAMHKGYTTLFITADVLLHLYHIVLSKVLEEAEYTAFEAINRIVKTLRSEYDAMLEQDIARSGIAPAEFKPQTSRQRALWLLTGYLAVLDALLEGNTKAAREDVARELGLIAGTGGFARSAIFGYDEDFSQYVPRGHYARSETLRRYFRAMMYCGRMSFVAVGRENEGDDAVVDMETARSQTLAALMLADRLMRPDLQQHMYRITVLSSLFVGLSDDITPAQYHSVLKATGVDITQGLSGQDYLRVREQVLKLPPPAIYNGTGSRPLDEDAGPDRGIADRARRATTGMRMLGQCFAIDDFVLGNMVWPSVGSYLGTGTPFTNAPSRTRATSLDFMSVLGSAHAAQALREEQLDNYSGYAAAHTRMSEQLGKLSEKDWHRNLYMGTLDAIRSLYAVHTDRQPFQNSDAWEFRQLMAGLGGWTALRQDTSLYRESGYSYRKGGIRGKPNRKASCFPEPEPEFLAKLAAMTGMLSNALFEIDMLDSLSHTTVKRLGAFEDLLRKLLVISIKQLELTELEAEEHDYLDNLPNVLSIVQGSDDDEWNPAVVSDVGTDAEATMVVQIGTGYLRPITVVVALPDGQIDVAVGLVHSWHEFLQPVSSRLDNDTWRGILNDNPPAPPAWERHFVSPQK